MGRQDYEIEKMLKEENREKKRIGCGVFSRASRRGYTGSVKTTVDYLKGKEKKNYMNNGKVVVSNMYSDIKNLPILSELRKLPAEQIKNILTEVKKAHTTSEISNALGYASSGGVYHLYDKYGVGYAKGSRAGIGGRKKGDKPSQKKKNENEIKEIPVAIKEEITVKGITLSFNGEFSGEVVNNKILSLLGAIANEDKYRVTFKVEEI